jgi:hypothetical protein
MRPCLILLCCLAIISFAGCTSKKTYVTNAGTTTVETNTLHNTLKITNKQGTAVIGRGAVSAAELELPLYPRAIAKLTGASTVSNTQGGKVYEVSLSTKDTFEETYRWYKERLPAGSEQTHMQASGGSIASFLVGKMGDRDQKSVLINQSSNLTTIVLTRTVNR